MRLAFQGTQSIYKIRQIAHKWIFTGVISFTLANPKSPYKTGPISTTRYKMERPRRGCVNLPYLAGTKKRPVNKGPYKLISPSK